MLSIICWSLALSLAINGVMFFVAFPLKSDKLTDASYAISFIVLATFAFLHSEKTTYDTIGMLLVDIWALRIGSFLLYRVLQTGSDRRFDTIRDSFWQFGKFWLGQAVTVWILLVPIALMLSEGRIGCKPAVISIALWLLGFAIESLADLQKYRFTHNSTYKGQWIDSGLWHYSRHPNYFGEILVWVSIYLYVLPNLSVGDRIIGIISPLFITLLLLFVSGVPVLEKSADARWGADPAYQAYKKRTSILIPLPRKGA